jgi:hypothetical protein
VKDGRRGVEKRQVGLVQAVAGVRVKKGWERKIFLLIYLKYFVNSIKLSFKPA